VPAAPELTATPLAGGSESPVLLVLTSLGGTVEDWRHAAALLGERFQVVGVDLPGHGLSPAAASSFEVSDLADAVELIGAGFAPRPVGIAGTSLGGAVVQELALRARRAVDDSRVDGGIAGPVAVVCSAPRMGTPDSWAERAAAVRREGTASLVGALAERWFSPAFRESDPLEVERVLAGVAAADDESYALCCEALGRWDVTSRLEGLTVPMLAVRGADDPVAPEEAMQPLLAQPRVSVVVLPGARHQAAVERPVEVAGAILAF